MVFKLTGRHVTDYSNASRTLLFDIRELSWDRELCELLSVDRLAARPAAQRARLRRDLRSAGTCRWRASPATSRPPSTARPAPGGARQEHLRNGELRAGERGRPGAEPDEGLLTTVAWGVGDRVDYALEAAIFVTGAAVQWLRDALGVIETAGETEELAGSLESNDGVYMVPAVHRAPARRTGTRTRAGPSSALRAGPAARTSPARRSVGIAQTVDAVKAMEELAA